MKRIFNEKGLTLVEIIVTLAVLGVVIAPLMSMFVTSQKINVESKKEYEALQLAQKYMEEIKAMEGLDMSEFAPVTYEDVAEGIGSFTGYVSSDGYDLTVKVAGAVDDAEGVVFDTVHFDSDETISTNDDINITSNLIKNVRRELDRNNLTINVLNKVPGHTVYLYIDSVAGQNYDSEVKILEGSVSVIKNRATELKPDNLLYEIEIAVKKGSEPINTIYGTTIFKYKPVKP